MANSTAPRIASVDVYRGFVMFLMMAEVLEYCRVSGSFPESGFWKMMCWHQSHVEWVGCSLHDMIQPSFSFLVGVALPYSIASRQHSGQAFSKLFGHTLWRSLVLILIGVFLRSMFSKQTYWTFEDTLSQIGLGYPILFLLGFRSVRWQIGAFLLLIIGYWAAFAAYPIAATGFDWATAGVTADWSHHAQGFAAHWNKNANFAWAADRWILNLFPRESTFLNNEGGYSTLSFIPTLGTMILGLLAGQILRDASLQSEKLKRFGIIGGSLITAGLLFHFLGICPIVKRIWTPTWTLFSGGACFGFLAAFYWLVDQKRIEKPFFWLKVIGMNSIAAYVLAHTVTGFIHQTMQIHFGESYENALGEGSSPLVRGGFMLLFMWLVLYWMWKKRLFIRV